MSLITLMLISFIFSGYWAVMVVVLSVSVMMSVINLFSSFPKLMVTEAVMSSPLGLLLTFLSLSLCLLSVISTPNVKEPLYIFMISLLGLVLLGVFNLSGLISFYILFEFSLIPTLALIIIWGYQPERLISGAYMMLYTVGASFPLFLTILFVSGNTGSSNYMIICNSYLFHGGALVLMSLCLAFLVKLPMYTVHVWLPKAHVEAPLAGSMMLAGVLLKLGGYGLWVGLPLLKLSFSGGVLSVVVSLALWGGLISCVVCLRQVDVKSFVAYSSVAHMSLVIVGLMMNTQWGIASSTITMFAHGFTSSCMFCLAYFSYTKVFSRSLSLMGGFLALYPMLSLSWFLLCMINMAAPPFMNMIGELFIVPCLWYIGSLIFLVVMGVMVFFSGCYNMFLYTSIAHGSPNKLDNPSLGLLGSEFTSITFHLLPMVLIFNMKYMMMYSSVLLFDQKL
uniref:NADH-ubiquinone oxidoreductase chain 4 n=1 Tax=Lissachatina fulica TaxID=2315439 RepID=A0A097J9J6_LISFU|nr:NADH dehydrogenase subunit 4 [Lissachatina fulica]AIE43761.1 NADH dehydrogenase subunit 4 [Lissachatina fulica]AIT76128.1 NADH dehydrogenase subunit 4 [Lissachatina fulica]WJZ53000.1 NADH dehydrogenase subunit 4 [Lissachatina fulica]